MLEVEKSNWKGRSSVHCQYPMFIYKASNFYRENDRAMVLQTYVMGEGALKTLFENGDKGKICLADEQYW